MHFDLIVAGGGAVGAALARAARGLSIAVVAGTRPAGMESAASGGFDTRVYALSPGNVEFLRSLKAWDTIPRGRIAPIRSMRVFGDAREASLDFDAYEAGIPELAWIVEDRVLQAALWAGLSTQDRLELHVPGRCIGLDMSDRATVTLEDGRQLEADLVVGADGADSFVRNAASIAATESSYGQTAVVANFECAHGHRDTAFQWFQGGPVLALLPLPGRAVSMVWSLPSEEALRVLALEANSLAAEVTEASGGVLGPLIPLNAPQGFPLRRLSARRMVLPHLALAGDAAHVVHPLAGQGLNLGLQDARALARTIAAREPVRGIGDLALLRRYERERGEAILAMRATVHGLHGLFNSASPTVRSARNFGLNLTDRVPVIKNFLLRHALD